ncbi:MAG: hypothetical protein ACLGIW_14810 [Gammaproteobacteria bacterium]
MGLGYEQLRVANPLLVVCDISGDGSNGTYWWPSPVVRSRSASPNLELRLQFSSDHLGACACACGA